MTDYHVHIGQWYDRYYTAEEVFDAMFLTDIEGAVFSSTTSEMHLPPAELYSKVTREVQDAVALAEREYKGRVVLPLFWYVPEYTLLGITAEKATADTPKCAGFKLHPYGNKWDFEYDAKQRELLEELFAYASEHKMMVLIHTGGKEEAAPSRFEEFFDSAPDAKIVLAHARPLDETMAVMRHHPHVLCDSAFVPGGDIASLVQAGLGERVLFGTDFPITHYWQSEKGKRNISMEEQYKEDMRGKYAIQAEV